MNRSTLWSRKRPRHSAFPLPNSCAMHCDRFFPQTARLPGCAMRALWNPATRIPASPSTKSFMARKTECYVDTPAWIAFLDRSDSCHGLFRKLFSDPPPLVTSALVVAEGHGWFLRRYDQRRAVQFLNFLEVMPGLTIRAFDSDELVKASQLVKKFADQKLTLADAHGLAVMRERHTSSCWSTDRHLGLTGVRLAI